MQRSSHQQEAAPVLWMRDERGALVPLVDPGGGSVVVVLTERWAAPGGAEDDALRAELRGLGATLVTIDRERVLRIRPDDAADPLTPDGGAWLELEHPFALFAAEAEIAGGGAVVLLVDARGVVRARHVVTKPDAVLAGLRAAGDVLRAGGVPFTLTRRELVTATLVAAFALLLGEGCAPQPPPLSPPPRPTSSTGEANVTLHVNGEARALSIEPRVTLLDALRERLGFTGAKKGCDHGQCGSCTVLVDGRRVLSCLTLAVTLHEGPAITTIEGLAKDGKLHPLQAAFLEHDGLQCGYCTPGQILSGLALLKENRARTDLEVREAMSGNLCRCGAYPNIVAAIQAARGRV